jgi:hypothetical protein
MNSKTAVLFALILTSSQLAAAKDSFWECTNKDGSIEHSIVKCDKGQKSKLIVLDTPPPETRASRKESGAYSLTGSYQQSSGGMYAVPTNCGHIPSDCDDAVQSTRQLSFERRTQCDIFKKQYVACANASMQ